jgi:hypothetical protein
MKTFFILILAFVVSPAFADVYKCNSGNKTTYQDSPCTNAKLIDNVNGLPPSRQQQIQAMEQLERERALVDRLIQAREAEARKAEARRAVTVTSSTVRPSPAATRPYGTDRYYGRPDRYYDRPDRYYDRSTNNNPSITIKRPNHQ